MIVWQGRVFDIVSIEPEGHSLGRVTGPRQSNASSFLVCPLCKVIHQTYGTNKNKNKTCAHCGYRSWNENTLLVALAGPEAERRLNAISRSMQVFRDVVLLNAPESDYCRVYDLSRRLHGFRTKPSAPLNHSEEMILEAHIGYMVKRVQWIFADRDNAGWKAVDALATALMSSKVLDFKRVLGTIDPILYSDVQARQNAAA
jgi:hypothetical protein